MSQNTIEGWVPANGTITIPTGTDAVRLFVGGKAAPFVQVGNTLELYTDEAGRNFRVTVEKRSRSGKPRPVSAGSIATRQWGLKRRLSTMMASQIYDNVVAQASTATSFCYHMTVVIPCDADYFVVPLDNASLTAPFRIRRAAIATSADIGADVSGLTLLQPRFTPNGTPWTPLTWNNGASSVEIPVAPSLGRKTRVLSDKIFCPTVPNTDGSKLRVVMLRFWVEGTAASPGNGYCTGGFTQAWRCLSANLAQHKGCYWQCIRGTVDGVSDPGAFIPTTDLGALPFLTALFYEAREPGLTIVGFGDSNMAGAVNANSGRLGNGWLWQLICLLRDKYPGLAIDMANVGQISAPAATYHQAALDYMDTGGPLGMVFYQPLSQNDGIPSDAKVAAARARLEEMDRLIGSRGLAVHVTTPMPNTDQAWTAPQDAIRLAARTELKKREGDRIVIDYEVVGDGATPARYQVAKTADNVHPNEAGHGDIAAGGVVSVGDLD